MSNLYYNYFKFNIDNKYWFLPGVNYYSIDLFDDFLTLYLDVIHLYDCLFVLGDSVSALVWRMLL